MVGAISRPFSGPHFHTILQHFFRPFCDPVFAHALVGDAGSRRPVSERLSARASTHTHPHAHPTRRLQASWGLEGGGTVPPPLGSPSVPRVPQVPQVPQVPRAAGATGAAGDASAADAAGAAGAEGAAVGFADPRSQGVQDRTR